MLSKIDKDFFFSNQTSFTLGQNTIWRKKLINMYQTYTHTYIAWNRYNISSLLVVLLVSTKCLKKTGNDFECR